MVTQTGRYALRTLGYLVDRQGERVQGREIAAATGIPANYLSKILNQLRKRGLVASQKGWGGGFALERRALALPISEVLEIFEGPRVLNGCIFELRECDDANPCPLHHRWQRVREQYEGMLSEVKVADLRANTRA